MAIYRVTIDPPEFGPDRLTDLKNATKFTLMCQYEEAEALYHKILSDSDLSEFERLWTESKRFKLRF